MIRPEQYRETVKNVETRKKELEALWKLQYIIAFLTLTPYLFTKANNNDFSAITFGLIPLWYIFSFAAGKWYVDDKTASMQFESAGRFTSIGALAGYAAAAFAVYKLSALIKPDSWLTAMLGIYAVAMSLGYLSGLVLAMLFTEEGVMFLYPFSPKKISFKNKMPKYAVTVLYIILLAVWGILILFGLTRMDIISNFISELHFNY